MDKITMTKPITLQVTRDCEITYKGKIKYSHLIPKVFDFLLECENEGLQFTCLQNSGVIFFHGESETCDVIGMGYRTKKTGVKIRIWEHNDD